MSYPHLFEEGYIGKVQIKNRIVMAPMGIPGLTEQSCAVNPQCGDERRLEIVPAAKQNKSWLWAVGRQPVDHLAVPAEILVDEAYLIGDSRSPRKIKDAIWEAFKWARIV